jgi:hypothetical protein
MSSTTMSSGASSSAPAGASVSDGQTIYTGALGASQTSDSGSSSQASSTSSAKSSAGRAAALQLGQTWGFVALAATFFGGFAILL